MSGLLGFMAAGAAKGYSEGRGQELDKKQDFDLKLALMDAQVEKELLLKEAGYKIDDKRAAAEMDRNKAYMTDVEVQGEQGATTRPATMQDGFDRAIKGGDFKSAETIKKMAPESKGFESVKLDDGSVMAFDKQSGTAKIVLEGGKQLNVPKTELELAWRMAGGDPAKAASILVSQKAKVSAAGRAPRAETEAATRKRDFIEAYKDNAEYVKNGKLTDKGFDKLNKIKQDDEVMDEVTEKTIEVDTSGNPIKERSVKTKVPKQADKVGRYVPGKGVVYD
jgi:hypothetical protein